MAKRSRKSNDAFTVKSYQIAKAPARIVLLGDKQIQIESAQHIIEFPGGAIEVSRTTDGKYWAHIIVNRDNAVDDTEGIRSRIGRVEQVRIDRAPAFDYPDESIDPVGIHQVAMLIGAED